VFARLLEAGCLVTAGVINIGDTDQEAAESLGIEYVEDAPFSPISDVAERANMEFVSSADAVVIADVPFGAGNLANLRCAIQAAKMGKPVAVIGDRTEYQARDFAGGKVTGMLNDLVERGASALNVVDELRNWVVKTRGS
jgi:iron complex transport system ATP-binding protein